MFVIQQPNLETLLQGSMNGVCGCRHEVSGLIFVNKQPDLESL